MLFSKDEKHLWTEIEVQILSEDTNTEKIIENIFQYCEDFEAEFSRFRWESSLSVLNKEKTLTISDRFLELFELAIKYMNETDGYFSPFTNVSALWYSQSFETWVFIPSCTLEWKNICDYEIEGNMVTLWENTSLDFWWIGKWFLVDEIASQLEILGYTRFCVNAGWDLVVRGKNQSNFPWGIWVENPLTWHDYAVFYCENCAINTSGGSRRKWKLENQEIHHLVNPQTGKNTNNYLSVTIIAESSAKADALTKVLWHTPKEQLETFFETYHVDGFVIDLENTFTLSRNMKWAYFFRSL